MRLPQTTCLALLAALAFSPAAVAADGGGAGYPDKSAGGTPMGVTPPADPAPPAEPAPAPAPPGAAGTIVNGKAIAPPHAPHAVRRMIVAANRLITKRYRWGGGHRSFARLDRGYDCSGAVSYALYGARLLLSPLDSSGLARFGERGAGSWVTVYGNRTHAYMIIAGLRFDTGAHDATTTPRGTGPRWSTTPRSPRGFKVRHPAGL
jgi:hypothetical protein